MTAKEKANELIDKFMLYSVQKTEISTETMQYEFNYKIKRDLAIQCAIIAVDEIIKVLHEKLYFHSKTLNIEYMFYKEVKTELEKL